MTRILSLSYGKDSLACLEACKLLGYPIDRVIHAEVWATQDIPADLPPMVEFKKKADRIIKERYGLTVEHISAQRERESGLITSQSSTLCSLRERISEESTDSLSSEDSGVLPISRHMGYKKIITYILQSENGASLKASNFICEGEAGGEMWTGKRSGRDNGVPKEKKTRWAKYLS